MDFSYEDYHSEIKQLAEEILKDFSMPDRLKKLEANGVYFDQELWNKFIETGIHSACLPEALGGMGMDFLAATITAESIGRNAVQIPFIPSVASTVLPLLSFINNPDVLRIINSFASGKEFISTAFIEPAHEDPLLTQTYAKLENGIWTLTGFKHCVPYAKQANTLLIFANSANGFWAGLVNTDQKNIAIVEQYCTSGEPQYKVELKNAEAVCIAEDEQAISLLRQSIAMTTVAYCAMAVGTADKMMRISGEYTSQREQFGVKIATFQAVAHRLADCYIDVECLKIATTKAANDICHNNFQSDSISIAKIWCGDVLARTSQSAQHVHGGTGIDRDYSLFRYCLWAKQLELSLGNSKHHLSSLADNLACKYLAQVQ